VRGQIIAILELDRAFRTPQEFFATARAVHSRLGRYCARSTQVMLHVRTVLTVGRQYLTANNTHETVRLAALWIRVILSDVIVSFKVLLY